MNNQILKIRTIPKEASNQIANDYESAFIVSNKVCGRAIQCSSYTEKLFYLNEEFLFEEIEVAGHPKVETDYTSLSVIYTSMDLNNWSYVGLFPDKLGTKMISFKVARSKAKYIKIQIFSVSFFFLGYFKIKPLVNNKNENLPSKTGEVKFEKLEVSKYSPHWRYGEGPGVLQDRNLKSAIVTDNKADIKITFNEVIFFEEMEVGGFTGVSDFCTEEGCGGESKIFTSVDSKKWIHVGEIPKGFGHKIIKFKVKKSKAKFLRVSKDYAYMAFGFLNVIPLQPKN